MHRKLFIASGLYLYPEPQLYYMLCIATFIEVCIMFVIMSKKNFFLEWPDFVILNCIMQYAVYTIFWLDRVAFFSTFFYINVFLVIFYLIFRKFKN